MLEVAAPQPGPSLPQIAGTPPAEHHISFHDVVSALNPLQYLPVIGTIYRAVTGDQIPEAIRRIGSLVVSGLIGGPIGVVTNLATMAVEKITGIDLDKTGQKLLAGMGGRDHPAAKPAAAVASSAKQAAPAPAPSQAPPSTQGWSPAQLAAYGVSTVADGTLKLANLSGADVLNSLELSRIQVAQIAYGRSAALATLPLV